MVFDAALAFGLLILVELEAWTGVLSTHRQGPHWGQGVTYGIAAAALVLRRRFPLACVLIVCGTLALGFAVFGSPEGFGVMVLPMVAVYSVARYSDRRRALWGLATGLALGLLWMAFDPLRTAPITYLQGSLWLTPWVASWLLGAYLRARHLYVDGLVREREERALKAVAEERNRIARELHDVIGHSLSVMTVQASAVRRLMRPDQDKERDALQTVEASGRQALAEMRRMVAVLRFPDEAADLAPSPTLDGLDRLVDDFRRAGLEVHTQITGARVPLPPGIGLTAYRVVEEALTNTLKHAEATSAAVRIDYRDDWVCITVRDDGHGPTSTGDQGIGLIGMQERVQIYGGSVSAGRGDGGGYEVRAELPLGGR